MGITRREFLQQSGATLATLGVSQVGLATRSYQSVLAAPPGRKLALLVGINQYPAAANLAGCVTDVALQRELLIHRFGFLPQDIVTLTDLQATREAIAQTFLAHLVEQAKAGDAVVFHFSGFGSQLVFGAATPQNTLVTANSTLAEPLVQDLSEDTLWLLLRSLKTDNITTVIDASHSDFGYPLLGNLRVRSRAHLPNGQLVRSELEFQERLLGQLQLDREQLATQQRSGQIPGLILRAGTIATEAEWDQFKAGLFTQALTQSLWQATPAITMRLCLRRIGEQVEFIRHQPPTFSGQRTQESPLSPYFLPALPQASAGAIVAIGESGKTVKLWLGGLPSTLLEHYGSNSLLTVQAIAPGNQAFLSLANTRAPIPATLQITARTGLMATAKVVTANTAAKLAPGQLVQEAVRVLPRAIQLTIALDQQLSKIERIDAISALSAIPYMAPAIAGADIADYLFSPTAQPVPSVAAKSTATVAASKAVSIAPSEGTDQQHYGLFSLGGDRVLETPVESHEAIKAAIRRLATKVSPLVAAKLLTLTVNDRGSRLGLRVIQELVIPEERLLMQQETPGTIPLLAAPNPGTPVIPLGQVGELVKVTIGHRIRYRLQNLSDRPLYVLALELTSSHHLVWLQALPDAIANRPNDSVNATAIALPVGDSLNLTTATGSDWLVQGPPGIAETFIVCSHAPFTQTQKLLQPLSSNGFAPGSALSNPLEIAQAILQDLHAASQSTEVDSKPDYYRFNMNNWASLRFLYQVT